MRKWEQHKTNKWVRCSYVSAYAYAYVAGVLTCLKKPIKPREKQVGIMDKADSLVFVYGVFSPLLFPAFDQFGIQLINYCKKQIDVRLLCVCPLIVKFRHNIVKIKAT